MVSAKSDSMVEGSRSGVIGAQYISTIRSLLESPGCKALLNEIRHGRAPLSLPSVNLGNILLRLLDQAAFSKSKSDSNKWASVYDAAIASISSNIGLSLQRGSATNDKNSEDTLRYAHVEQVGGVVSSHERECDADPAATDSCRTHGLKVLTGEELALDPVNEKDIEKRTSLLRSLLRGHSKADEKDKDGNTCLHVAASIGATDICVEYIEGCADLHALNKEGRSCLHVSAMCGHTNTCMELIARGLDANTKDNKGLSALHLAAENNHTSTCVFLIKGGGGTHSPDSLGLTPLHRACISYKHIDTCKALIEHGASLTDKDNLGQTCFHKAVNCDSGKLCVSLLQAGASLKDKDYDGNTPLDLAKLGANRMLIELLEASDSEPGKLRVYEERDAYALSTIPQHGRGFQLEDDISSEVGPTTSVTEKERARFEDLDDAMGNLNLDSRNGGNHTQIAAASAFESTNTQIVPASAYGSTTHVDSILGANQSAEHMRENENILEAERWITALKAELQNAKKQIGIEYEEKMRAEGVVAGLRQMLVDMEARVAYLEANLRQMDAQLNGEVQHRTGLEIQLSREAYAREIAESNAFAEQQRAASAHMYVQRIESDLHTENEKRINAERMLHDAERRASQHAHTISKDTDTIRTLEAQITKLETTMLWEDTRLELSMHEKCMTEGSASSSAGEVNPFSRNLSVESSLGSAIVPHAGSMYAHAGSMYANGKSEQNGASERVHASAHTSTHANVPKPLQKSSSVSLVSYECLSAACDGFTTPIGKKGGMGYGFGRQLTTYAGRLVLGESGSEPAVRVAVKNISAVDLQTLGDVLHSLSTNANLPHHSNTLPYLAVCLEPLYVVYPYMDSGSLAEHIDDPVKRLAMQWDRRVLIMVDVLNGLGFLHNQGVIHGNLKSQNILLDSNMRARLTDFGMPYHVSEHHVTMQSVLEAFKFTVPSREGRCTQPSFVSDMYSCGVVALQALMGSISIDVLSQVRAASHGERLTHVIDRTTFWPPNVARNYANIALHCTCAPPKWPPCANDAAISFNYLVEKDSPSRVSPHSVLSKRILPNSYASITRSASTCSMNMNVQEEGHLGEICHYWEKRLHCNDQNCVKRHPPHVPEELDICVNFDNVKYCSRGMKCRYVHRGLGGDRKIDPEVNTSRRKRRSSLPNIGGGPMT